jgi:hypothetical protein
LPVVILKFATGSYNERLDYFHTGLICAGKFRDLCRHPVWLFCSPLMFVDGDHDHHWQGVYSAYMHHRNPAMGESSWRRLTDWPGREHGEVKDLTCIEVLVDGSVDPRGWKELLILNDEAVILQVLHPNPPPTEYHQNAAVVGIRTRLHQQNWMGRAIRQPPTSPP